MFASAVLCSAAIGGTLESAPALAADASPVAGGLQGAIQLESVPSAVGPGVNLECGDPGYDAPRRTQVASLLCRLNAVRSVKLVESPVLDEVAEEKLDDIVNCGDDFSHYACGRDPFFHFPSLTPPWSRGEILARGARKLGAAIKNYAVLGTVHGAFAGWHKSPEHWPLIKNEAYTLVGIAVKRVRNIDIFGIPWKSGVYTGVEFLGPDTALEDPTP